jgi:hypothetical protein
MPSKLYKIGRRAFRGCASLESLILPVTLREIGFDAFSGCKNLKRLAMPKSLIEMEDSDVFSGCDSLSEIAYAGSRDDWEYLTRGRALTVTRTDLSVYTPKIHCLDLKK